VADRAIAAIPVLNSSYRGLRFHFQGTTSGAYRVFLALPLASAFTLFALFPLWQHRVKQYLHGNATYGRTPFAFDAPVSSFYRIYLIAGAMAVGVVVVLVVPFIVLAAIAPVPDDAGKGSGLATAVATIAVLVAAVVYVVGLTALWCYTRARLQNLVWAPTTLGPHLFACRLPARRLLFILLSNMAGIVFTLGLFKPFADIRLTRYAVSRFSLVTVGNFDDFVAGERQQVAAVGRGGHREVRRRRRDLGNARVVSIESVEAAYFDGEHARSCRVTLTFDGPDAVVSGGGVMRTAPIAVLTITDTLGAAPRLVRFPDGAFCEVTDHAAFGRLLAAHGLTGSAVSRWERSRSWIAASAIAFVLLVLAAYRFGVPVIAGAVADRLPTAAAERLSREVLGLLDGRILLPSALPNERRAQLIAALGRLHMPAWPEPVPCRIESRASKVLGANAMALPSGVIIVTDGLVALAKDDREILAVLAHEAGHVVRRHGLRQLLQNSIVSLIVTWYVGDISSLVAAAPTALLQAKYSRDLEREADDYAAGVLRANGLPLSHLADILQRLDTTHRLTRDGAADSFDYLASHPATAERLERLRSR
jgi:Zn-dependent protease with chaperone function